MDGAIDEHHVRVRPEGLERTRRAIHLRHACPLLAAPDQRREGLPLGVGAGGTLQRSLVQADVGRIRDVYRRSGRDDVRVVPLTS